MEFLESALQKIFQAYLVVCVMRSAGNLLLFPGKIHPEKISYAFQSEKVR